MYLHFTKTHFICQKMRNLLLIIKYKHKSSVSSFQFEKNCFYSLLPIIRVLYPNFLVLIFYVGTLVITLSLCHFILTAFLITNHICTRAYSYLTQYIRNIRINFGHVTTFMYLIILFQKGLAVNIN